MGEVGLDCSHVAIEGGIIPTECGAEQVMTEISFAFRPQLLPFHFQTFTKELYPQISQVIRLCTKTVFDILYVILFSKMNGLVDEFLHKLSLEKTPLKLVSIQRCQPSILGISFQ